MNNAPRSRRQTFPRFAPVATRVIIMGLVALAPGCGGSSSEPPPAPPGAIPAGASIGTSAIAGRVRFLGEPPERKPLNMSGEAACRKPGDVALSEEMIVNDNGTLRNAYVRVVSGLGDRVFAPPATELKMDQRGCIFIPHLLAARANQVIAFKSSDTVVHNVRTVAKENPRFNVSMSGRGRTVKRFFPNPEIVQIRCDIHAWMAAYIAVSDHPFHSVTGADGAFSIDGLPAGSFEIEVWHERLGTSRQSVTLGEGERRELEFSFEK
jgi:plastocyanin